MILIGDFSIKIMDSHEVSLNFCHRVARLIWSEKISGFSWKKWIVQIRRVIFKKTKQKNPQHTDRAPDKMADGVWTDGQRDGFAITLIINQLFFCNVPTFEDTILITTS